MTRLTWVVVGVGLAVTIALALHARGLRRDLARAGEARHRIEYLCSQTAAEWKAALDEDGLALAEDEPDPQQFSEARARARSLATRITVPAFTACVWASGVPAAEQDAWTDRYWKARVAYVTSRDAEASRAALQAMWRTFADVHAIVRAR